MTRAMTETEIELDYEAATGTALAELISEHGQELPCALVRGHGPFCWGPDAAAAVQIAVTLEEVARLALLTTMLNPSAPALAGALREKHFQRKHGPGAYYGQQPA